MSFLDNIEETGNLIEAVFWIIAGLGMALATLVRGKGLRTLGFTTSVVLALFGISDLVEAKTGAWWRPPWLLFWKAGCIIALCACATAYYRIKIRRANVDGLQGQLNAIGDHDFKQTGDVPQMNYFNLRHVRQALQEFSDPELQRQLWLSDGSNGSLVSSFTEALEHLFDDSGLGHALEAGKAGLGIEAEAALVELEKALRKVDDDHGPEKTIDDPTMVKVRAIATRLLDLIPSEPPESSP